MNKTTRFFTKTFFLFPYVMIFPLAISAQSRVEVIEALHAPCKMEDNYMQLADRIVSKELQNDTLYLELAFVANCAVPKKIAVSFKNNILRVWHVYPKTDEYEIADCDCCFQIVLLIKGLRYTNFRTFLNRKELFETPYKYLPYEILNGDTLNRTDAKGNKIGLWRERERYWDREWGNYCEFYDSLGQVRWTAYYHRNGRLEYFEEDDYRETFYENGLPKSKCRVIRRKQNGQTISLDSCRKWDRNGKETITVKKY